MPEIVQQIVVNRKKGILEFSLVPIVERDGKMQFLVSFMVALTSKPKSKHALAKQRQGATNTDIYAAHSVLANGKWAKIRVKENGIYHLTADVIRKAGFSDINKVHIYGYGGNLQNEVLSKERLKEFDDLKEVPICVVDGKHLFYGRAFCKLGIKNLHYSHSQPLFRLWLLFHYGKRQSTIDNRARSLPFSGLSFSRRLS